MPDYVSSSACRGRRPRRLDGVRAHSRPNLVNRLMRERSVARFIVAPDGFGKSEVALEYADVIFSFKNVFWFDANSPCFLRDLDRGTFADVIVGKDPSVKLVVFDGVPRLDSDRADELSRTIDCLLERGSEVVVTVSPSCDAYDSRQSDRIRLGAGDMLLTDAEIDVDRSGEERQRVPASSVRAADRVAVMAWGGEKRCERFLEGVVKEDLPADALAAIFEMLVIGAGRVDGLSAGAAASSVESMGAGSFAASYPYLGIDADAERFDAPDVPIEAVARAFSPRLSAIAAELSDEGTDDLVARLANRLVACGRADRACGLVRAASSRSAREAWLASADRSLTEGGCLEQACALYASARPSCSAAGGRLRVGEAIRRWVLGDADAARELALRTALSPTAADEARCIGAALALQVGAGDDRDAVIAALARTVRLDAADPQVARAVVDRVDVARCLWWPIGAVALAAEKGLAEGVAAWEALERAGAPSFSLAAAGACLIDRAAGADRDDAVEDARESLSGIAAHLVAFVEKEAGAADGAGLLSTVCLRAIERAQEHAIVPVRRDPAAAAVRSVRRLQERVLIQRAAHLARMREARATADAPRQGDGAPAHRRAQPPRSPAPPVLRIDLFGGLEASIGGVRVDSPLLKRKKVKALIALLTFDAGREIPRDTLVAALWPASPTDTARKNLYTLWGLARRALSLPDGTCPYLVRMQNGYKLDDRAFESDVRRADELVRMLLFGHADARTWSEVLSELGQLCSADLLPCDVDCEHIALRRTDYRDRVTDALVSASRRLGDEGDVQTSLWFARAAYDRDRAREDVYAALMRAQIASGQRTSALSTFFECRRFLADGLGIDPSAEIVSLYRSIIEEEAIVDW